LKHGVFYRILIILALYFGLTYFGGIWGWRVLYPIRLFVTFLHEFGHALGSILTGGSVEHIRINANGSGVTASRGGHRGITIMGGYIGSAIFGNVLFYIGAKSKTLVKPTVGIVILAMLITGFIWYNSVFTTLVMSVFSAALFFIGFKTKYGRDILMLLGLISVIYIIQDTGRGPSSDLRAFEGIIPARIWMYIWLVIALGILALNMKLLFSAKDVRKNSL